MYDAALKIKTEKSRNAKLDATKTQEEYYEQLYKNYYEDNVKPYLDKKKGGTMQKTTHFPNYVQQVYEKDSSGKLVKVNKDWGACTQIETESSITITQDSTGKQLFKRQKDPSERATSGLTPKYEDSNLKGMINDSMKRSTKVPEDIQDITLGDVVAVANQVKVEYPYDIMAAIIDECIEYGHYEPVNAELGLDDELIDSHRFDDFSVPVRPKAKKFLLAFEKYLQALPKK
jgi:hypothetical protein